MGKHKAPKMTKQEREIYENFHADPANPKLRIRSVGDLIMLPYLLIIGFPIFVFNVAMVTLTVLGKIFSPFSRKG